MRQEEKGEEKGGGGEREGGRGKVGRKREGELTCSDARVYSVTVQMPDVITTDAHVFTLSKTNTTLAAKRTGRMKTLLSCLYTQTFTNFF